MRKARSEYRNCNDIKKIKYDVIIACRMQVVVKSRQQCSGNSDSEDVGSSGKRIKQT